MTNAETARRWFLANGGTRIDEHFVAATTNVEAAARFGITRTFGFWDWVGGRYSLWSAIGLPIAIAIGAEGFRALLAGARAMDEHFAGAGRAQPADAARPGRRLVPQLPRLREPLRRALRASAAAAARLPAAARDGKQRQARRPSGESLPFATSPVVWGEPGTNAQHAYFQMLHQGTDLVRSNSSCVKQPRRRGGAVAHGALAQQHRMLLANGLAQSQALMQGRARRATEPHRDFPGNRPSTTFVLERLTPRSLGALLALYEHRVFTSGAIWGIDSFDQWGVELGKTLGARLLPPRPAAGAADVPRSTRRRPDCCGASIASGPPPRSSRRPRSAAKAVKIAPCRPCVPPAERVVE